MATVSEHYDDGNRAFLQAFMARGTLTFKEARPILAAIFSINESETVSPDQVTQEDFESYLATASDAISFFDYEVRTTVHQATKHRIYALVNTTSDPMTQLATTYTPEELAFTKRLLEAVFDTYNTPRMEALCISEMQAIKLARPPRPNPNTVGGDEDNNGEGTQTQTQTQSTSDKGLKHSEVEQMLVKLTSQGWLEKSSEGFFSVSPRGLMELRTWLVDSFNDPDAAPEDWQRIKFCEACKDVVTHGQRCSERDCNIRLHDICEDAFWRMQRGKACPRCSKAWTGDRFVGERAITSTEAYHRGRRKSGNRRSNRVAEEALEGSDGGGGDGGA